MHTVCSLMTSKPEPPIWLGDTGQQISLFGRCQLTIIWMSLSTYWMEYGGHLARLRRRHGRAYAPTSKTASHANHEEINSSFPFSFLYGYWAALDGPSGRRSSAITNKNESPNKLNWKIYIYDLNWKRSMKTSKARWLSFLFIYFLFFLLFYAV